jgi:hypothetical protein
MAKKKRPTPKPAPMGSSLSEIVRGIRAFIFGPSGVGKTSMIAHLPDIGFICDPLEEGILDLQQYHQVPGAVGENLLATPDTFEELLEVLDGIPGTVLKNGNKIKNLGLDSATGMEKLAFAYHCREYFDNDWTKEGFYSFQQGPKNAAKVDWPRLLDILEQIAKTGINVWFIGHSQIKPFNNPEGPDYDRFIPCLDKETWAATHRWANVVFFYNHNTVVKAEKGKNKAELDQSEGRFLMTVRTPAYDAKNRMGLHPLIEAGESGKEAARNMMKAIAKARAGKQEE